MSIACNLVQTNGAVATYHVLQSINISFSPQQIEAFYICYASQDYYENNAPSIANLSIDCTPLFSIGSSQISGPIGPALKAAIDNYAIATPQFSGGKVVS
jgi:hypothetical protein